MRVVSILAALLIVAGLAACGGGGGPSDLNLPSTPPPTVATTLPASIGSPAPTVGATATTLPAYASLVAHSHVARLAVYDAPDTSQLGRELPRPQVLLVETRRADGWVRVVLPVQPAGTTGWVRDTDVTIIAVPYKVGVELVRQRITVSNRGRVVYTGPIVVGAAAASTPPGRYFLHSVVAARASHMTPSPFAYALVPRLVAMLPLGTPVDIAA